MLPLPSPNDLFLDLESNPYVLDQGLEYVFGFLMVSGNPQYERLWSFDRAQERGAFQTFMEMVMDRWEQDAAMHIYHYAPYEPTAIKRLAGRHNICVDEVDELLRGGVCGSLSGGTATACEHRLRATPLRDLSLCTVSLAQYRSAKPIMHSAISRQR